jgi:hypothetical protein
MKKTTGWYNLVLNVGYQMGTIVFLYSCLLMQYD